GLVRDAAINPNVDGIVAFGCPGRETKLSSKVVIIHFEPDIRATLSHEIGEFSDNLCIENGLSIFRVENGQRHAPASLPRNYPVGARFNCTGDAVLAPCWNPLHFIVDGIKRSSPQRIDPNKKLLNIAEDDGRF